MSRASVRAYYMLLGAAAFAPPDPGGECSPFTPPPAIGGTYSVLQPVSATPAIGGVFEVCEPITGVQ